jgi:hypothetical protein
MRLRIQLAFGYDPTKGVTIVIVMADLPLLGAPVAGEVQEKTMLQVLDTRARRQTERRPKGSGNASPDADDQTETANRVERKFGK